MEIAKAYDSLPYPTKFFVQTHPDRLSTLGGLFGIDTKHPNECRVLELGCGNGSNLISHAYNLQGSNFVGIDISSEHIKEAKKTVESLKLTNIEFYEIDIAKIFVEDLGKFDYITAHGLISWVPEFVREKVFTTFKEMLEPNGVGYASYNAYPGAHQRDMVRQMMRFHTKGIEEPLTKVQESISFLSMLAKNSNETQLHKPILKRELERHFKHEASDIYHDDLSDNYRPYYFHEFAKLLNDNDMQFLCESELHAMSVQGFSPQIQEMLVEKEDIIEREQYLDFLLGRIFRQTLFCHQDTKIDRTLEPAGINDYLIASSVKSANKDPKLSVPTPERFIGNKGFGMEIDHPPTKTALNILGDYWGKAIATEKLLHEVRQQLKESEFTTEDWDKEFNITRAILFQVYQGTDLVELRTYQNEVTQEVSKMPKINKLSRWQISCANNVTTQFYINIKIDDEVSRNLLKILDGTRNHQQLIDETKDFIKGNDEINGKQELLNDIENWLDESLTQLAKLGMFVS